MGLLAKDGDGKPNWPTDDRHMGPAVHRRAVCFGARLSPDGYGLAYEEALIRLPEARGSTFPLY
jgi:hypothetical protein